MEERQVNLASRGDVPDQPGHGGGGSPWRPTPPVVVHNPGWRPPIWHRPPVRAVAGYTFEIHEAYAVTAIGVHYTLFQPQDTGVFETGDSRGATLSDTPEAISVSSSYGQPSIQVYFQQ